MGQILKLSEKNTLSMGMRQIEFTLNVMFGSLSNDNVCLQITDREGLQNVTQHLRQRREQLSAQANTTCSCEILTNKHEIDAKSNISRS